jgi:hypothetical protein
MYRRSLVALAVGLLGLVAISPVFATDSTPSASPPADMSSSSSSPSSSASSTTMSSSAGSSTSSTTMGSGASSSSSTTTTSHTGTPSKAPPSSQQVCSPDTAQSVAPEEGKSEVYPAGEAGEVEVKRDSPTDLSVVQATDKTGWTDEVSGPTGPRVKVKFSNAAGPPWVVRFAASMDQAGRMIHVRVSTCK